MRYFPAFVDVHLALILVVGGGEAATQKVRLLRKTTARIRVVALELSEELQDLASRGEVEWVHAAFHPTQLADCRLVFATTGDRIQDAGVAFAARSRSIPVNVVDVPQLCTFITPAMVDRDPVLIAIGTEGAAPVLTQQIKSMLESWLPAQIGQLASLAARLRPEFARYRPNGQRRRQFWRDFFEGNIARQFYAGDRLGAASTARATMGGADARIAKGRVALVGAGPGDPDLLTFKAARALQQADVIVTDRLVNPAILEVARRDARRIDVGKSPGRPSIAQDEINRILVEEALRGNFVVRLKGGDPLIFGRAGEEIDALQAHAIDVDIIPGITSALAAAASAGALLTERDCRRSLTVLTGHASDGYAEHDWSALSRAGQTIAIYMGIGAAGRIRDQLMNAGIDPVAEVTIVENASMPNERILRGRVDELPELVRSGGVTGSAIILIGPRSTRVHVANSELRKVA